MAQEFNGDQLKLEVSFNERSRNDQVYFYLEHSEHDAAIECYLEKLDFKNMLKAMLRLDEEMSASGEG